jgi:hypothetical protein
VRCLGSRAAMSVKMAMKADAAFHRSRPVNAAVSRNEVMRTGTIDLTVFSTTPNVYASSLCKSVDPMNVKMGMTLCKTASGTRRASSAATRSARCDVRGLVVVRMVLIIGSMPIWYFCTSAGSYWSAWFKLYMPVNSPQYARARPK